jgi:hypothetical protein
MGRWRSKSTKLSSRSVAPLRRMIHNPLKSSGTPPNFLITLASLKSPLTRLPFRAARYGSALSQIRWRREDGSEAPWKDRTSECPNSHATAKKRPQRRGGELRPSDAKAGAGIWVVPNQATLTAFVPVPYFQSGLGSLRIGTVCADRQLPGDCAIQEQCQRRQRPYYAWRRCAVFLSSALAKLAAFRGSYILRSLFVRMSSDEIARHRFARVGHVRRYPHGVLRTRIRPDLQWPVLMLRVA